MVMKENPDRKKNWFSIYLSLIILDIWQGFEYASGSKYPRVLIMQQLRTVLDILECAWKIMNISRYVWILLNKQASKYNITSICYFVALLNRENQLFINGRA